MSDYDNYISRSDAAALIPEEVSREIIQGVIQESAVLTLGRRLQDMPRGQTRMPVLSQLPTGYFVSGDTGLKKTTEQLWANKYLDAEEIAVIVPIPQAVLDDSAYDIWGEVRPRIQEEFGRVFDRASLFGINKPSAWPAGVAIAAIAAENAVTLGTGADLYEDLMGEDGLIAKVEEDGFLVTGHVADLSMRARLRGLRSATEGIPLFVRSMREGTPYELDGEPIVFPRNGVFDATTQAIGLQIAGDFSQLVYAFRQDITYKILDQGVLSDAEGVVTLNLAQQDMVALRAVMRIAWNCPNPINRVNPTEGGVIETVDTPGRYPFAVLEPAASA